MRNHKKESKLLRQWCWVLSTSLSSSNSTVPSDASSIPIRYFTQTNDDATVPLTSTRLHFLRRNGLPHTQQPNLLIYPKRSKTSQARFRIHRKKIDECIVSMTSQKGIRQSQLAIQQKWRSLDKIVVQQKEHRLNCGQCGFPFIVFCKL